MVAAVALLASFVIGYGRAVHMPVSLIDDIVNLTNATRFLDRWQENGFVYAVKRDFSVEQGQLNIGFMMSRYLLFYLFGERWWAHHMVKLLELGVLLIAMAALVWMDLRQRALTYAPAVPAACMVAGVLLLWAEVPFWSNMQTLRANWYRLSTTDSFLVALVVPGIALLWYGIAQQARVRRVVALAAAALLLDAATTVKLTSVVLIAPLGIGMLLLASVRDRRAIPLAITLAVVAAITGSFLLAMRSLAGEASGTYRSGYSLNHEQMRVMRDFLRDSYRQVMGPLIVAGALGIASRLVLSVPWRGQIREMLRRNTLQVMLVLVWFAGTIVYLPWPHPLPRYLLHGLPALCIVIGIEVALQVSLWHRVGIRPLDWLVASVGATAALLLSPAWFAGLAAVFILLALWRTTRIKPAPFLVGAFASGLVFFLAGGFVSQRGLRINLIRGEHVREQVLDHTLKLWRDGRSLVFAGDTSDEHIGSMALLAERRKIIPRIKSLGSVADTSKFDIILVSQQLTPEPLARMLHGNTRVENVFICDDYAPSPVGFDVWRTNLWKEKKLEFTGGIHSRQSWVFLQPPGR